LPCLPGGGLSSAGFVEPVQGRRQERGGLVGDGSVGSVLQTKATNNCERIETENRFEKKVQLFFSRKTLIRHDDFEPMYVQTVCAAEYAT
jgi:hypothetical protein